MTEIKTKIIQHAQQRFMREGFYKISMDDFARSLRMSKKTIYECYQSKEQIVREATMDFFLNRKNEVAAIINSEVNAVLKMTGILRVIAAAIKNIEGPFFNDLRLHLPEVWQEVDEFRAAFMRANFKRILDQGIQEGLFRPVETEVVLPVIVNGMRSVVQPEFILNSSLASRDILRETFEFVISGLATPEGKAVFTNSIKETAL